MPKRVQLANGRVFFAKYQRVDRNVLLETVGVRRTYVRKIGPKRQQKRRNNVSRGTPTQDLISTVIGLETKSNIRKMIINDAIDYVPTAYKKLTSKRKKEKGESLARYRCCGLYCK